MKYPLTDIASPQYGRGGTVRGGGSMPAVTFSDVHKEFASGNVHALEGVSFEVAESELLVLLGPSGCGKTTSLRLIAGLEEPDGGEIWLGERLVSAAARNVFVQPEKRNVGMVFQSYAIWPHMTVFENVAYPLQVRRMPKHVQRQKVEQTLSLVGLQGYEKRPATQLSGGQQQRVALARAMVFEPKLLLLDEPLSNLDAKLRIHMRTELKHLQQQTGITMVFVTHDQAESMALADRIVVMNRGSIEQVGSPADIYERPRTRFVSEFIGSMNVLEAAVDSVAPSETGAVLTLRHGSGQLVRCFAVNDAHVSQGQQVLVSIRPEKLTFLAGAGSNGVNGLNVWEGRVTSAAYYGDHREYEVEVDDQLFKVSTPVTIVAERGDQVRVACDPSEMVIMTSSA
jgi:iron(III) transport system ATP-binding protein